MEEGTKARTKRDEGKRKPFVLQPRKNPRRWLASDEAAPVENSRRVFPRHFRNPVPLAGLSSPRKKEKAGENEGSSRRRRLTLIDIVKSRRDLIPLEQFP
jgi:hypothetical protein